MYVKKYLSRTTTMLLTLLMVNNQTLQMQKFEENTPYIQENLGIAKLVNFYDKSYFHINMTNIRLSFQKLVSNTYFLSLKINNTSNNFNIFFLFFKQLESRVEAVENKLNLIMHNKIKRSLVDGLGTVIRYVTGNLDQNDLNNIMVNINKLRNNEEQLASRNTHFLSILSKLEEKFANNSLIISENLKKLTLKLNEINTEITIQAILTELLYIETFEQFLSTIITTITLSIREEINISIINFQESSQLYDLLNTLFSKEELIPF